MPTHPEAVRLNLEYYRKQAKALLKSAKAGDAAVVQRIANRTNTTNPALHDAQLTIAREQGFPSWPRFRAFIIQSGLDFHGLVDAFIDAAISDRRQAENILASHPEIAGAGFYPALLLGDVPRVRQELDDRPDCVREKGGPRNSEPLLYACFSRLNAATVAEIAGTLIAAGADPNASWIDPQYPDWPLSCLYGASGHNNNLELTGILLAAGANPNDGESLYHSLEHADLACARLLLEHGASPSNPNVLNHMLDRDDPDGVRLLLAAGVDPNQLNNRGETSLHWAVWRGRGAAIIAALLDAGANIDAQRRDGRTAYSIAALSGQTETAALLESRGAGTELQPLDRFLSEQASGPPPAGLTFESDARLLTDLASMNAVSAVRALLAAGMPVETRGEHGATALHWACWKGYADLVRLLLDHGAPLTIEDEEYQGTPAGWLCHGLRNHGESAGDYAEAARLLLAAGAKIPNADIPTGFATVDAVFREFGVIR